MIASLFWKARILIFYFVIAILCLIVAPFCFLFNRWLSYSSMYQICKYFSITYILCAKYICSLKYSVRGLDKLPNTPCVVLSNHQSFWENIFMQMVIPQHTWVIKQELYKIPLLGPTFVKCLDPISVNRKDPLSIHNIIKQGVKKINQGLWIVLFPEGTRVAIDKKSTLKPVGVKLAMMAKVPIVVISLNSGLFWPPTSFWIKQPGIITVEITKVIYPEEIKGQDVREVNLTIEGIMNDSKSQLVQEYNNTLIIHGIDSKNISSDPYK
jgi:1-acyl-sn-glycerol-3-phosphate acyltransferase